ncbi:hypothetical protein OIU79_021995 [Salix purpurea]|uniref:Uncharacterized protein n=1 Tax=Salix purpurea TaxID=77065 RepID=A0A9Q0WFT4_SALPP|nr:hypothetical protein OIU79_021995 [Salix purpurea]
MISIMFYFTNLFLSLFLPLFFLALLSSRWVFSCSNILGSIAVFLRF